MPLVVSLTVGTAGVMIEVNAAPRESATDDDSVAGSPAPRSRSRFPRCCASVRSRLRQEPGHDPHEIRAGIPDPAALGVDQGRPPQPVLPHTSSASATNPSIS